VTAVIRWSESFKISLISTYFLKKTAAEKFIDLDTGDKIEIIATVFSNALNDPWLDIVELKVLQKAKK
jgi:hypothetical protein